LPDTAIHVLSNGRAFVRDEVVAAWTALRHPNLVAGIPIYSAVDHVHDYVVQAKGAFDETVLGMRATSKTGSPVSGELGEMASTAARLFCPALAVAKP
jgi:hypothetical protein